MKVKLLPLLLLIFVSANVVFGQKYSYAAQKALIPAELGKVYLGMPLRDFVKNFDLKNNRANIQFEEIKLEIPINKGNIEFIEIKAAGATTEEKQAAVKSVIVKTADGFDDEMLKIVPEKIPAKAFVYEIYVRYKPNFDIKTFAVKTFGKQFSTDSNQQNLLYSMQWAKKSSDRLKWLIRAYDGEFPKGLMMAGRIKGTEWELPA